MTTSTIEQKAQIRQMVSETMKDYLYKDRRRAALARHLDTDWPQIPAIRDALADYIGMEITKHDTPIVLIALERAANSYEKRIGQKPDQIRFQAFLDNALELLVDSLNGCRVYGSDGSLWRHDCGVAFYVWTERHELHELKREKGGNAEAERIRRSILTHLQPLLPRSYNWGD